MASTISSLWSDKIKPTARSPLALVTEQAEALTNQTNRTLVGDVIRGVSDDGKEQLYLDIVVPVLNGYRHRILGLAFDKDMVYPVTLNAEIFHSAILSAQVATARSIFRGEPREKPTNQADSDEELRSLLEKALQSPQVVSVAQSLIARANDAIEEKERQARTKFAADLSPDKPTDTVQ